MVIKKDLSKVIDKLIQIKPDLKDELEPIKKKYSRQKKTILNYWNKLFVILNNHSFDKNTKNKIMKTVLPKRSVRRNENTFDSPHANEKIVGPIPENIADNIRRQDKLLVRLQKLSLEAQMTNNRNLLMDLEKKQARLEIKQKKVWLDLREYFNLWKRNTQYFSIRKKGPILVLTKQQKRPNQRQMGIKAPQSGVIQVSPEMLKEFFRMMNLEPPPGMFPEDEEE